MLTSIPKLINLSLNKNEIESIDFLSDFHFLKIAELNQNKLSILTSDKIPTYLTRLEISENLIKTLDVETIRKPSLEILSVQKNEFDNIPSEITNQGNSLWDARMWFEDLKKESIENYDVKLMIIGNGRVGKTSLLKRMFLDKFDPEEDSTHGIKLYSHTLDANFCNKPLKINTWDFGGQEIYHATHRLFMQSRALYLTIWDKNSENQQYESQMIEGKKVLFKNYQLTYWLDHARSLSWKSPLLVLQNKTDTDGPLIPKGMESLQMRHNVLNFLQVSASSGRWSIDFKGIYVGGI